MGIACQMPAQKQSISAGGKEIGKKYMNACVSSLLIIKLAFHVYTDVILLAAP